MDIPALDRTYLLQNKATGFRLEVYGEADGLDAKVSTRRNGGIPWRFLGTDVPGCYRLVDEYTGRVLDSNANQQAYTLPPNDGNYQKWRMIDDGEGYWCLHNLSTGLALDSNADEDAYTMQPNDGAYQRWSFLIPA
jgi:Ricin-type beta-trefoil lectin domain-like